MDEADWLAIWRYAGVVKAEAGTDAFPNQVIGRFISVLVGRLLIFWGRHRSTLQPALTQLAIAALDALLASKPAFDNLNPPGPP